MSTEYDPAVDSKLSWEDGIAAVREKRIRAGLITPQTDEERAQAAEGPVPPEQLLHAGRR